MPRKAHPWFRSSDSWWYVKINGKPVKLAFGKDSASAAVARWHELMAERAKNPAPESGDHTVASIIDLYLTSAQKRYSPRTYEERFHYLQAFAEDRGWRKVAECLPFHLTSWLDNYTTLKSDWTIAHVIAIIHRPFNWAAKQRLIPANPFRGVTHRQGEPRRPLTDEEFQALLRSTSILVKRKPPKKRYPSDRPRKRPSPGARFRQLLIFLRFTGCRPGEAAALEWTDIDLDNAVVVLQKHKTVQLQRVPKPRVIPLHPVVVKLLVRIRQRQESGSRVFLTHRKTPWNKANLSLRMQRARKIASIPADAKLYGLRHAFGTRSVINGVDLKTLAELMGHTTTRMTEHYVHLVGQRAHLAAAMLQANGHRSVL